MSPLPAPEPRPAPTDASEGRTAPGERFEGHGERECGEHRTTGRRAWCFDCQEWCYPDIPCRGCELPLLRARAERAEAALRDLTDPRPCDPHPGNGYCQTHGETPPCPHAAAKEILDRTEETP